VRRGPPIALVVASLLAACADPVPSSSPRTATPTPAETSPAPSEPEPSEPSAAPTPLLAVEPPGRPYDAEAMLAAMRESRRPGGVPDELETEAIAAAVADQVWTIGGEPWATIGIGGSCGPRTCQLEVAGSRGGGIGEDLYVFDVDLDDSTVTLLDSVLLGLEPETITGLDRVAREGWDEDLSGYGLAAVRWLPPPDDGRFELSYRSGGEEGSPQVDLIVDVDAGTVEPRPAS
jgi:hypothetical protein